MKNGNSRSNSGKKILFITVLLCILTPVVIFLRAEIRENYCWLPNYIRQSLTPNPVNKVQGPVHIMFLMADHWEPRSDEVVHKWAAEYPPIARRHHDADGVMPQHTFFWMFFEADEKKSFEYLQNLAGLSYGRYGEVEKHLHHDEDTSQGFIEKMNAAQQLAVWTGSNITAETTPRKTFGFIHGRWALDNSRGDKSCHVNNELILLRELGCYADFTMPAWGRMASSMINEIYYATDDPEKPKSYDKGVPMAVGKPGVGDILMFTGQSVISFHGLRPVYDHGEISEKDIPTPDRIDAWIRKGVHVDGQPDWIFVKVFTHGAFPEIVPVILGDWRERMHEYLEKNYNDGTRYVLHYVTAREAYNIAKAAEAGKTGNPNQYRDYLIPPYVNRYFLSSEAFDTISFENEKAVIRFRGKTGDEVSVRIRAHNVEVSGGAEVISKQSLRDETVLTLKLTGGVTGFTYSGLGTEMLEILTNAEPAAKAAGAR